MSTRTIWKARLELTDEPRITWPEGSEPMAVMLDSAGILNVWFQCDPDARRVQQDFRIIGTGHPYPEGCEYLGSVVQGPFVWHVFIPELR